MVGTQLTQPDDRLRRLPLSELIQQIRFPSDDLRSQIELLRNQQLIDTRLYQQSKRRLPYYVNALFHPAYRKKENFSSISSFTIDLDHVHVAQLTCEEIKKRLAKDPRVYMAFTSPGGSGLKIIFLLKERCTDSAVFSAFYKAFVAQFGAHYHLQPVIDLRTHDVTRASFLSADPDAIFHPEATMINIEDFIDLSDATQFRRQAEESSELMNQWSTQREMPHGPDDDILRLISERLQCTPRRSAQKQYFVPPRVDEIIPIIKEKLASWSIELVDSAPINYGRKLRFKAGQHHAELNLFYGKKGFKVVITPKWGTNWQLADMTRKILEELLADFL